MAARKKRAGPEVLFCEWWDRRLARTKSKAAILGFRNTAEQAFLVGYSGEKWVGELDGVVEEAYLAGKESVS